MGFSGAESRWLDRLGRLRDVVRQELVARQLREVLGEHRRVLDVGCGQGTQSLVLARAGHSVTGLDPSTDLLARFQDLLAQEASDVRDRVHVVRGVGEDAPTLTPGPFEVVLCHGVLMYLDDVEPLLNALSTVATAKATLSLLVRNGLAPAMRPGLLGDWNAACTAFDHVEYVNRLGVNARMHTPDQLDTLLAPLGWTRTQWFGVRVFTDHLDGSAPSGQELDALLAAEGEAGRRDPYRQTAALLHLVYSRDESSAVLSRA